MFERNELLLFSAHPVIIFVQDEKVFVDEYVRKFSLLNYKCKICEALKFEFFMYHSWMKVFHSALERRINCNFNAFNFSFFLSTSLLAFFVFFSSSEIITSWRFIVDKFSKAFNVGSKERQKNMKSCKTFKSAFRLIKYPRFWSLSTRQKKFQTYFSSFNGKIIRKCVWSLTDEYSDEKSIIVLVKVLWKLILYFKVLLFFHIISFTSSVKIP